MQLSNILFLDIETVPQYDTFEKAEETYRKLWEEKARFLLQSDDDSPSSVFERAGIYAEFGKIVCISVGLINDKESSRELRIKSYASDNEKELLTEFADMVSKHFDTPDHILCGHNGKEFDFPYIARRMIVNGIRLPKILDTAGKKPWEVNHADTMQMWKFGDFKNFTSLKLLAYIFNLPTPKDDIDGSQVAGVYWKEKNLQRIVTYCEKDVVTLVQVYLKLTGRPILSKEEINLPGAE